MKLVDLIANNALLEEVREKAYETWKTKFDTEINNEHILKSLNDI